jgi:exonuclease VII large subunit
MQNLVEIITAVGGGGAVSSLATYFSVRRRLGTHLEDSYMRRFDEAIKRREERIDKLEKELDKNRRETLEVVREEREQCRKELLELEGRLSDKWERQLTGQLRALTSQEMDAHDEAP